MTGRILCQAILVALCLSGGPARAEERTPRAIYQQTLAATAWVAVPTSVDKWDVGTACVVNRSRKLVVTNFHVVGNRDEVLLQFPAYEGEQLITERDFYMKRLVKGDCIKGKVLDVDPKRDLALIEAESLPAGTTELKLAPAAPLPGDRIHAVGNPVDSMGQWLFTTGTVRQVHRTQETFDGLERICRVVAVQLPISKGDSGGPVVNDAGMLVGIAMSYQRQFTSVGQCVAAEEVQTLLNYLDPRSADDFNLRGVRAFQAGRWERAVADFTEAVRLDPKKAQFYQNRAWALRRQGDDARAITDFTRAVDLEPKNSTLFNERGFAYLETGKLTEALADFDAAIRIDPQHAVAHNNRGVVRFKKGQLAEAIADYGAALRIDPNYAQAYSNRGTAYLDKGEPEKALADFTEVIRLQPQSAAAYLDRSRAHAANNDPARAKADRDKAISLNPSLAR
jgi:Tfp pilus assembly protein PilF